MPGDVEDLDVPFRLAGIVHSGGLQDARTNVVHVHLLADVRRQRRRDIGRADPQRVVKITREMVGQHSVEQQIEQEQRAGKQQADRQDQARSQRQPLHGLSRSA